MATCRTDGGGGLGLLFIAHNPHRAHVVDDHFGVLRPGTRKPSAARDPITQSELEGEARGRDEPAGEPPTALPSPAGGVQGRILAWDTQDLRPPYSPAGGTPRLLLTSRSPATIRYTPYAKGPHTTA